MSATTGDDSAPPHIAVVGGGIAGLAAAYFLQAQHARSERQGQAAPRVTVYEGEPEIGGKLRVSEVAGVPVDEAADALLARRPEGQDLVRAVGLGDDLVPAAAGGASIWSHGALRPLPDSHVMGVPGDLAALARSEVLSPAGLARVPLDLVLPGTRIDGDMAVGAYVASRLGVEAVDRLVDPLLGGVYAGHAGLLSLDATVPQLAEAARTRRSLVQGARALQGQPKANSGPPFTTLRQGLGTLPDAVARATPANIRTSATVRELRRTAGGWRLTIGPTRDPESVNADAVVLAVPAGPASRLLAWDVPAASAELESIDYASIITVTLAYHRTAFRRPPQQNGFLVPAVEGRLIKAATFSTSKWPHLAEQAPDTVLVRCSMGRYGEEHTLQRPDADLISAATSELGEMLGLQQAPVDSRVSRWGGALPQYAVGHRDRVARVRSAVGAVPGLAVCGAAYDGLGVPACVATAESAASQVLGDLASSG